MAETSRPERSAASQRRGGEAEGADRLHRPYLRRTRGTAGDRGDPGVVKIHGHISRGQSRDIVLTKNHYRQLSSDSAFWDVLKAVLSTRTFLFIGCSMSDPDIFALLDEVIEEGRLRVASGESEEPPPLHYALLSGEAWKPAFVRHLRDDYRIAALPVRNGPDGSR